VQQAFEYADKLYHYQAYFCLVAYHNEGAGLLAFWQVRRIGRKNGFFTA